MTPAPCGHAGDMVVAENLGLGPLLEKAIKKFEQKAHQEGEQGNLGSKKTVRVLPSPAKNAAL